MVERVDEHGSGHERDGDEIDGEISKGDSTEDETDEDETEGRYDRYVDVLLGLADLF